MNVKALLGAVSALALFGASAMAQTTPSTDTTNPTPPAAGSGAQAPATGMGSDTTTTPGAAGTGSSPSTGTMTQAPATGTGMGTGSTGATMPASGEPVVASHLMGQDVQGSDGEDIGSVADLVIDTGTGQIQQVVIRSGGVLGVGGKQVAIDFDELKLVPNEGVQANLTEEQLEGMPEFDDDTTVSLDAQVTAPATGAAPGAAPGAGGGMTGTTPAPGGATAPAPRQ
jgi:sporulation protein YlmC with PRC-barrel domain